jgi:PAS domain S-box-containing protein
MCLNGTNAAKRTYGIKREKVIGKSIFDVLPQLKDSEVLTYFQRVLKGETLYLKDQKEVVKAGYANLLMTPVKDQKENIIAVLTIPA